MISGLIGGILAVLMWHLWQNYRSRTAEKEVAEQAETKAAETENSARKSCKDVVLDSLRQLQCEPEVIDRGEGRYSIEFNYQAEGFSINIDPTSRFVVLYDPFWYSFDENDLQQLSNAKNIINSINWESSLNVCYTKTDENNMFNLHTTYSMLCFEEGDFTAYLRHILNECFVVHNNFFKQMVEASAKANS